MSTAALIRPREAKSRTYGSIGLERFMETSTLAVTPPGDAALQTQALQQAFCQSFAHAH